MTSVLETKSVLKRYRGHEVLKGVSLSVSGGEVVGILGPNGAGKTTCFYLILGLLRPDGGDVFFDGKPIGALPVWRRARQGIGYLPQEPSIFMRLTVMENILAILELHEPSRSKRFSRLEAILFTLRIGHLADQQAASLSGGERRRVEIGRALALSPRFMLLDEPFAGVDPLAVADIQGAVALLAKEGIGVLITDHNVRETLGVCDRAYILEEGRLLAQGAPQDLVQDDKVRRAYLGEHFRL